MRLPALIGATLLFLTACGDEEVFLPGERLPVRGADDLGVIDSAADTAGVEAPALSLPAATRLAAWPMRVGNAANDPGHATLSAAPARLWSAPIGAGDSRRQRLTADPVSDGRLIFTLDARAAATATTLAGQTVWSRSLVPGNERDGDASGGGLAVVDGTLYATTGFGELHALDPINGGTRWVQRLDAPVTTPKVAGGLVYVVSRDGRAWAIEAETGRVRWEIPSTAAQAVTATAPAPAIGGRSVFLPFGSGEIVAALPQSGIRVWGAILAGARDGVAYSNVEDITADPVLSGGRLFAGTTAGRLIALSASSGQRDWTLAEGAVSPAVVTGGSVFAVTDRAQLIRVDAETGAVLWRRDLPFYKTRRVARRDAVFAHYGPVLAGGRLWVASGDGALRGFDPRTGTLQSQAEIPGGAASRPIAFGDALYVVGRRGALHAFR